MNISTAVSAIGSAFNTLGKAAITSLPAFAPLIASALGPKQRSNGMNYPTSPYGLTAGFMPGGPSLNLPSVGMGGLALATRNVGLFTPDPYGGMRSPVGSSQCITPYEMPGRLVLPRTVNVPNPNNPSVIETYVKAPRVKYRVSVSRVGGKRRCSGGH